MSSIPEGHELTKAGVIPEEWRIESVSNLSHKTNGFNPINNPDRAFRYIDVPCISLDTPTITKYLEYIGENAPSRARKLIKTGDILFSTIRLYLKQLAKVPPTLDGEVCSTAFCIIRCNTEKADPDYAFQLIARDNFVFKVTSLQIGSNYPAVIDIDITSPFIPLPEQHHIAAERDHRALLQVLKKGLMQDLLTGRVRVPLNGGEAHGA